MSAPTSADPSELPLFFLDTNVLIYAIDTADLEKQKMAQEWRNALWKSRRGRLSLQVLKEFYANAMRINPGARDESRAEVRDLLAWAPIATDAALLALAWRLQDRYPLSFWDALIVAAAKATRCRYLLSEDFQAGQEFDEVQVVNPFRQDSSLLLQ